MRRLKLTTRSSEYKNLRHVVPSLRLQRDVGEVEVVTEAARYIDHLHKTLIERFVVCGIPDSLKDVLGTNNANELCSQHIMNLVSRMAANQRQQQEQQNPANSGSSAAPALDNNRGEQMGTTRRKSRCHRRGQAPALEGAIFGANAEPTGRRSQKQQHRARHQNSSAANNSTAGRRQSSQAEAAQISARDHIKTNASRRTNLPKLVLKDCGQNVHHKPAALAKAKRNPITIMLPRIQQAPISFVKSTTSSTKLPLQITDTIESPGSQSTKHMPS